MGIGIALAGGGIRGIAHAGVLKAIEEKNIKIDAIGGTSAGSIVATLYAMGYKPYYIYILFKKYAQEIINLGNVQIVNGIGSFIKNKKVGIAGINDGTLLEKMFNELAVRKKFRMIGDIKMPIVIPTVDVSEAKEYVFTNCAPRDKKKDKYITEIEIGKAVRASCSFPAVFCPCDFGEHKFLDGGALDNVPVIEVKKQGIKKVLAVNFKPDDITEESNYMDIAMRTIDLMGNKIAEDNLKQSDYILTIKTDKTGLLDLKKIDSCYEYGYKATIKEIDKIKEIIQEK